MRFVICGAGAIGGGLGGQLAKAGLAVILIDRGAVEAESLNGEIVRLGRQYGVPTPYNSLRLELITELAVARALPGAYTVQQLRERVRD